MANAIDAKQLTPGALIWVRGKIDYSRITKPITGAELAASDQRKVQNGLSAVNRPHITITLAHAVVQSQDPANPTIEDQFVSERRRQSPKRPESGLRYSKDFVGTQLPIIAVPSPKGDGTYDQDNTGQEFAQGMDVTLLLRVYKPKNNPNCGLALEQVIANEPPRYYAGKSVSQEELAARGIVFNTPPQPISADSGAPEQQIAPQPAQGQFPTEQTAPPAGTQMENGFALPAPNLTPTPAPVQQVPAPAVPPQTAPESPAQKLARLQAETAALQAAGAGNEGSAVGSPVGAPAGANGSPWADQAAPGQQRQPGIAYPPR